MWFHSACHVSGGAAMQQPSQTHRRTCIHTVSPHSRVMQRPRLHPHCGHMGANATHTCRPSRPFRHTCTKDGHFCVQGSSQTTLELDLTDVNFLIWLLSVMQACTQQLLCCDIFIFLWVFFFFFFLGLSVFYCIILKRNCVGSYRLSLDPWQWSVAVVGYGLSHSITYQPTKTNFVFCPCTYRLCMPIAPKPCAPSTKCYVHIYCPSSFPISLSLFSQ